MKWQKNNARYLSRGSAWDKLRDGLPVLHPELMKLLRVDERLKDKVKGHHCLRCVATVDWHHGPDVRLSSSMTLHQWNQLHLLIIQPMLSLHHHSPVKINAQCTNTCTNKLYFYLLYNTFMGFDLTYVRHICAAVGPTKMSFRILWNHGKMETDEFGEHRLIKEHISVFNIYSGSFCGRLGSYHAAKSSKAIRQITNQSNTEK